MQCLIEGCNHKQSRRGRMHTNNSWFRFQICPCCFVELNLMHVFPTLERSFLVPNQGCKYQLQDELESIAITSGDTEIRSKMELKKKYPKRMSYEGTAM